MKNAKLISIAIVSVAVILSLTVIAVNWKNFQGESETIDTRGSSTIEVEANKVSLYLAYEARADTAEEAQEDNSATVNDILNSLKIAGASADELETMNYNIYPEYDWEDGERIQKGYLATHTIKLTTEDIDRIGIYIDAAVDAGANRINNIDYGLTDDLKEDLRAQALKEATQNARSKAEAIAEGAGAKVVKIKSITDNYNYNPWNYRVAYDAAKVGTAESIEIPTQVETGKVTISATVSAIFEIN